MRFLIDENAPYALVRLLTDRGHDVDAVAQIAPRLGDADIMVRWSDRIVVTFDRDFGRLIFYEGVAPPLGVVLMRGRPSQVADVVAQFLALLDSGRIGPHGRFIVIEPNGAFRDLPLSREQQNG